MLDIAPFFESTIKVLHLPHLFYFSEYYKELDNIFLPICYILPAQILGSYKSIQSGLQPGAPSANNGITKVVKGVEIYSLV